MHRGGDWSKQGAHPERACVAAAAHRHVRSGRLPRAARARGVQVALLRRHAVVDRREAARVEQRRARLLAAVREGGDARQVLHVDGGVGRGHSGVARVLKHFTLQARAAAAPALLARRAPADEEEDEEDQQHDGERCTGAGCSAERFAIALDVSGARSGANSAGPFDRAGWRGQMRSKEQRGGERRTGDRGRHPSITRGGGRRDVGGWLRRGRAAGGLGLRARLTHCLR